MEQGVNLSSRLPNNLAAGTIIVIQARPVNLAGAFFWVKDM